MIEGIEDIESADYVQSTKKQVQRLRDINRIERKTFREKSRYENALSAYTDELIKVFDKTKLQVGLPIQSDVSEYGGVVHISDTHFNELVNIEGVNMYDFNVASKRLFKYVYEAKRIFKSYGITDVLVCLTGDLMNSDRRLDELLSMACNRSKATFLSVELLLNVLNDLATDFNVSVAGVIGNESRVREDIGYADEIVSDSYDFTMFNILKRIVVGVDFIGISERTEQVVNFYNNNILLIHGNQSGFGKTPATGIDRSIRKYADKKINIDHILFGHIHETMIADLYSRSSSLVGANDYSEKGLLLTSRASQNLHIIKKDVWHSMKIDLQNTDNDGYDISELTDVYNAKSAGKNKDSSVVIKVDTVI